MSDYTWTDGDALADEAVPEGDIPTRFALTAPQCIYRAGGAELLVVDPHPSGNWMSWMFPYASLVLTSEQLSERGVQHISEDLTFHGLADYLRDARSVLKEEYERSIEMEVNNIIPGIGAGWSGPAFFENYSLKFSKTSESYTAYAFEYHRVIRDDLEISLPHLWVPVRNAKAFLGDEQNLLGRSVSSNVLDLIEATADGRAK